MTTTVTETSTLVSFTDSNGNGLEVFDVKDGWADIELPIEEIVIIAMFLIKDEEDTEGHPVLLYIFLIHRIYRDLVSVRILLYAYLEFFP